MDEKNYKNSEEGKTFLNRIGETLYKRNLIAKAEFMDIGKLIIMDANAHYKKDIKKVEYFKDKIDFFSKQLVFAKSNENYKIIKQVIMEIEEEIEYLTTKSKLKWCDNNYLSLLGLIELLDFAGYLPENSYQKAGEIMSTHFLKQNNEPISRKGLNNKKKEYEDKRHEILGILLDKINSANNRLLS